MTNVVRLRNGSAICALLAAAFAAAPASANIEGGLKIVNADHHDTSLPLRDMIRAYNKQHAHDVHVGHHVVPLLPGPATRKLPATVADGIEGGSFVPGKVGTTDLLDFDGVDDAHSLCGCAPAGYEWCGWRDPVCAVGEHRFCDLRQNHGCSNFRSYRGNALWSGFAGRCQSNNDGDPIPQSIRTPGGG